VLDAAGYLRRLGLAAGEPSATGLAALQRAHLERVAYTCLDVYRGQPPSIDPYESAARVAAGGRGGYCFHLNGALSLLLRTLGYDVHRHRGWVSAGVDAAPGFANHLALTVRGLPGLGNPGGAWFVDAGLADGPHEPVPLRSTTIVQSGITYRLGPSPVLPGGWRFEHDPRGSFRTMDFEPDEAAPDAFAASHRELSTAPTSGFVRWLSTFQRHDQGFDRLISRTLIRARPEKTTYERIEGAPTLRAVLAEQFGLRTDDIAADEWSALYQRISADQDAYDRATSGRAGADG
jgi:arylamine N-acetyltransferase